MRSTVLVILFLIALPTVGQKKYDFDFTDQTLYDALEQLSGKHKFKFSYNPELLKKHTLYRRIRANSDADLISELFEGLPFKIQLADGVYLVIPRKIEKPLKLAGKVLDKDTGKPLAFAHVQSTEKGAVSNQDGRFSLPPRQDTITIQVSYIGYKDLQLEVPPHQQDIALSLEQNPYELQEVILNATPSRELTGRPSFFSLNPEQFNALPTLGETDVFKSIQLLPGIQATDETSSGLSVRGGTPSQNLVMMDGFTLYHLDHFFGIFSTLNPNVINNVSVFKGGFGSEYGGRISSVIDVTGKAGSADGFSAKAGINLLSFNGTLETPIGSRSSVIVGFRQSFTDIINSNLYKDFLSSNREAYLESVNPDIASLNLKPSLSFFDLNGKFQTRFNPNSVLDVNLYASEDSYQADFTETDEFSTFSVLDQASWSNLGLSANWRANFNPKWHSNFTVGASEFSDEEKLAIDQTFFVQVALGLDTLARDSEIELFNYGVSSTVSDVTIKSDHEIDIDQHSTIRTGVEFNAISTNYDSDQFLLSNFVDDIVVRDTLVLEANILSLYSSYLFRAANFSSSIGLRSSYYQPNKTWYIEPRFDLSFNIDEHFTLKGAASYHNQFVNQTSLSFFQNNDKFYWTLADDETIPILKSSHIILGGNYIINNWTVDLEYYRKNTTGILENRFVTRAPTTSSFSPTPSFDLGGENVAEGLDLFIKYRAERFTSWLSYSLGSSNNSFWYIDQNNPFPSNFDQRHEINLASIYKVKNWELSSTIIYGSGKPYTAPIFENDTLYYSGEHLNDQRLPDYFRLDLAAKYSFSLGKSTCETGLTLFNLLDHRNIRSRRFTQQVIFDETDANITSDEIRLVSLDTKLLGFTPNFFFNIRF